MTAAPPLRRVFEQAGAVLADECGGAHVRHVAGMETEYAAVRRHFGIADESAAAKLRVRGDAARDVLDIVLSGNVRSAPENTMRATLALNEDGSVLTDVVVYCGFDDYLLLAETDALDALRERIEEHGDGALDVADVTAQLGILRVDGPSAADLPRALIGLEASGLRLMSYVECRTDGAPVTVGRVGTAGEYGYQFVADHETLGALFARLSGAEPNVVLCGRDVYDVLFLEMRAFNRRLDLPEAEPPLAAGLHWMVDFRKPAFVGRDAVMASKSALARRMICVRIEEGGGAVPARGDGVYIDGERRGYIANSARSPQLGTAIALAYLDTPVAAVGVPLEVETGAGRVGGHTVSAPFVRTRSNAPPTEAGLAAG